MHRISKLSWGVGILICFATSIYSQPKTNITLTDVNGNLSLAGVYTSPYLGTVGGAQNVPIICDDFASETYLNESWSAYVTNLSQITTSSPVKWQGGYGWNGSAWTNLSQAEAYTAAAYLATQIMTAGSDATRQKDLSFALWALFDFPDANGPFSSNYLGNSAYSNDLAAAKGYLASAVAATQNQTLADYANVTVYSYVPGTPCGHASCPPGPQEFLRVSMAEPSYPAILAVDLLTVIGLIAVLRRRMTGILN